MPINTEERGTGTIHMYTSILRLSAGKEHNLYAFQIPHRLKNSVMTYPHVVYSLF